MYKKIEPFSILADIFLRLIKMIVAPLVLTTLIVGVAKLGDIRSVGRIGGKTLLWFIGASLTSLLLGLILVNIFKHGIAMDLPLPDRSEDTGITRVGLTLKGFLYHVFPTSLMDAMAKNEILQIVVFSLFFGVATAAIGEQGKIVINFLDAVAHVILKLTGYSLAGADLSALGTPHEVALAQAIAQFPEVLERAAREFAPHLVSFYLHDELAARLHTYYNAERFLVEDEAVKLARLALVAATRQVLANGLAVLGVSAPERM